MDARARTLPTKIKPRNDSFRVTVRTRGRRVRSTRGNVELATGGLRFYTVRRSAQITVDRHSNDRTK